jgi:hypothetical protein
VHDIKGVIDDPITNERVTRTISGCLILRNVFEALKVRKSTTKIGSLSYILDTHALDVDNSRSLTQPGDTAQRKRKVLVLSKGAFDDDLRRALLDIMRRSFMPNLHSLDRKLFR